jgi:predicted Zn-dependent protease
VCALIFSYSALVAQTSDEQNQLALLYFSRGEYEKAIPLYEQLYAKNHSSIYFDYCIRAHSALKQYDKAIALTKEQLKLFPQQVHYTATLARLYEESNQAKQAEEIYQKMVKHSAKTAGEYAETGRALAENKKYDYALAVYDAGLKKFSLSEDLQRAKMELLLRQGDYENLTKTCVELLQNDESFLPTAENYIQAVFAKNTAQSLQTACQTIVEQAAVKNAHVPALQDLLVWMYVQQNNFKRAFVFAKSLDMRYKETGERVYELGETALSNEQYNLASDCFSYIVEKGNHTHLYNPALTKLLDISYKQLFAHATPTAAQVQQLEKQYEKALEELGTTTETMNVMRTLAHIQAFYLHKTEQALALLQTAETLPGAAYSDRAQCALEKADVYLFAGDIWTANMLYAKIALDYKSNDIGNEARLKQAQVAYYTSQFSYAQALLDVLKASTSKLIANNAFELSQLISDNTITDEDSSHYALQLFAKADLALYQNKPAQARLYLDSIQSEFLYHSLTDDVLMRKALAAQAQNDTADMVAHLTAITQQYSYDVYADNAYFMLAEYYQNTAKNSAKAKELYKILMLDYPQSYYCTIARKRFRELEL